MKTVFLTGANGFVGAGILHHLLEVTDWDFLIPTTSDHHGSQTRLNNVRLNYESNRLQTLDGRSFRSRVKQVHLDLTQPFNHTVFGDSPEPHYILNVASESHVDRSIENPRPFIRNNVDLMVNVLEYAREVKPSIVLQMSTDEVYGNALEDEYHVEWSMIRPSNPYSASKAAQEAIAYSYWRTYNVPLIITNTMNLVAPASVTYQSTEKFLPMVIRNLLDGKEVKIHVDENGESGSRCWIDVRDFAAAWKSLIDQVEFSREFYGEGLHYYPDQGYLPHRFNIVGEERSNRDVAKYVADLLGIDSPNLVDVDFHQSRPGHDPRYALDGWKMQGFWSGPRPLNETLADIVDDYRRYPRFLRDV